MTDIAKGLRDLVTYFGNGRDPQRGDMMDMMRAANEIDRLERELDEKDKRIVELEQAYYEVSKRLNSIICRNHRITKLLRSALPEQRAIGCGLEGMVQSLLAIAVSGERIDVRAACKDCGGSGEFYVNGAWSADKCPSCHGHGWRKEG